MTPQRSHTLVIATKIEKLEPTRLKLEGKIVEGETRKRLYCANL